MNPCPSCGARWGEVHAAGCRRLVYGSVCSGIEAATVAWHPLGWKPAWFAEVAPFPSAVLAHRHPNVPNLGDLNGLLTNPPPAVDVLIGGTPCQSFSVAGLRGGITDARGNLALAFMALAGLLRPRWVVWENVPGVLSSNGGRDFGSILGALGELGYGYAYRVLDAQYFGLAQRRKRVFVVGHLGDWRRTAAVLFEPDRLRRDSPPSRQAPEGVAGGAAGGPGVGRRDVDAGGLPEGAEVSAIGLRDSDGQTARSLNAHPTRMGLDTETFIAHTLRGTGHDASEDGTGRGVPLVPVAFAHQTGGDMRLGRDAESGTTPTIQRSQGMAVVYQCHGSNVGEMGTLRKGNGAVTGGVPFVQFLRQNTGDGGNRQVLSTREPQPCLNLREPNALASPTHGVRRLMPVEMERLQGFPDGHTAIPWRGKSADLCPDGHRAEALGNSMATTCIRWIGENIQRVDDLSTLSQDPHAP